MEGPNRAALRNTVRAPGAPFARQRVAHTGKLLINRESEALRASVLDIAMEIGLGMNGAVTDWVYNNSISEEEEPVSSPSMTAPSSANSDACSSTSSTRFPYSQPTTSRSISSSIKSLASSQNTFSPSTFSIPEESSSIYQTDTEPPGSIRTLSVATSITFSDPPMHLPPLSIRIPSKLKKRRTDGYESEGGYMSDTKDKRKDRKEKVGKTSGSSESSANDVKARAKEEKEHAKRQKEAARQRVKSLTSKRSEKDVKVADSLASKGYETDAPSRKRFGKKRLGDPGYETDAGYLSSGSPASGLKKAKTRFFGLGGKSSKSDLVTSVPKVAPSIPPPLPIAQKFGTTLGKNEVEPLPVLPPLPSLDTELICTVPAMNPASSTGSSPASPLPIIPSGPPVGRVMSVSSKKDSLSEMGVRDSQISGESSGSSISNASTSFSQESRASRLKGFRFLSPSKSSSTLPPSKFPTISLPLTRATSPAPSDAGISANQSQEPGESLSSDILRSPKLCPSARGSLIQETRGRSPVSPASPAFLSPTSLQRSVSPALSSPGTPPVIISTAPSSPAISRAPSLKPQANLTVNTSHSLSPIPSKRLSRGRSPSPIPSSEWIVPSPSGTSMTRSSYASSMTLPIPSPNIYSVYDIPPPSPPPNAPLPKVPVEVKNDVEEDPFGVNGTSVICSLNQPERAKDLSFLARLRGQSVSNGNTKTSERSLVPTIRRISKQLIPTSSSSISDPSSQRRSGSSTIEEPYDDGSADQELQDVLDRFISELSSSSDKHEAAGTALGRRQSSEVLRNDELASSEPKPNVSEDREDDADSQHSSDPSRRRRSTLYYSDMEEDGADPRLSRWSGSIYSRASFMDPQRSEETRARFVKRVEAMLDEAGIERGNKRDWDAVPPVPKLPEALAQSNLLTRQNQLKGAGPTPNINGWI